MRREDVLSALMRNEYELREMGVKSLAVFGSTVRDDAGPDSDVDLLVEFDRPVSLFHFVRVQQLIQDRLGGMEVDLVLRDAVLDELKDNIFGEAVNVL